MRFFKMSSVLFLICSVIACSDDKDELPDFIIDGDSIKTSITYGDTFLSSAGDSVSFRMEIDLDCQIIAIKNEVTGKTAETYFLVKKDFAEVDKNGNQEIHIGWFESKKNPTEKNSFSLKCEEKPEGETRSVTFLINAIETPHNSSITFVQK